MKIVTLYCTRSAAASCKSLYRVEMSVSSLSYTRDILRVARENPLVSYPILDPCFRFQHTSIGLIQKYNNQPKTKNRLKRTYSVSKIIDSNIDSFLNVPILA